MRWWYLSCLQEKLLLIVLKYHNMAIWNDDNELFCIAKKELFVALVGDALDKLKFRNQFLPPAIKPLHDNFILIGSFAS